VLDAGIAGLTTALLLKSAGLRVAVIEAARVSGATTGHTTAKVSAQHGLIYDTLRSRFGNDGARPYAEANLAAVEVVESLVREHRIGATGSGARPTPTPNRTPTPARSSKRSKPPKRPACPPATPIRPTCRGR
jgi:glycine/D-amino acid oxidase-like deaminating enzyme